MKSLSKAPLPSLLPPPSSLLLLLALFGCQETLVHDLDEAQAQRLMVILEVEGIDAELVRGREQGRWEVEVPEASAPKARALMVAAGMPGVEAPSADHGLMGPDLSARREEEGRLKARQLEDALMSLAGVDSAEVRLALPDPMMVRGAPPTRAVAILVVSPEALNREALVLDTITLLSHGVSGLNSSEIQVLVEESPQKQASPEPMSELGPWRVSPHAHTSLQATLLTLISLVLILGLTLAFLILRGRRRRHEEIS